MDEIGADDYGAEICMECAGTGEGAEYCGNYPHDYFVRLNCTHCLGRGFVGWRFKEITAEKVNSARKSNSERMEEALNKLFPNGWIDFIMGINK